MNLTKCSWIPSLFQTLSVLGSIDYEMTRLGETEVHRTRIQFTENSFLYFIYLFLDRREWREKEKERNINVWLPLMHPLLGTWLTTQACALTGNWTSDPLVHRPALNPLSHTSQGQFTKFYTLQMYSLVIHLSLAFVVSFTVLKMIWFKKFFLIPRWSNTHVSSIVSLIV